MDDSSLFWFALTFACIFIQGFYSMAEMASVSFNKVRLQYYVSKGDTRAIWLNTLMQNPSRLFGTTLLGVNVSLQIGSECSRRFYQSMDLSPDVAPLTQVLLVLIFAELSPMFAARHYAEHVAMIGTPIVYWSSRLVKPVTWAIGNISKLANYLVGGQVQEASAIYLTREELQKIFEERDDVLNTPEENDEFNTIVSNIFHVRGKTARQVMTPTHAIPMIEAKSTVAHFRSLLENSPLSHVPVYHRSRRNIVGIVSFRDLLNASGNELIKNFSRPPWFLAEHSKLLPILEQFQGNQKKLAVVLDDNGLARGILTLEDILNEIFGNISEKENSSLLHKRVIERSFPGSMEIKDFNEQFNANLRFQGKETLAELLNKHFDHHPEKGESVRIENFELTVEESSLLGAKTISVRTILD